MTTTTTPTTHSPSAPTRRSLDEIEQRKPRSSGKERAFAGVSHAVLIIWSVIVIGPMLWVLITSFKSAGAIITDPSGLPTSLDFTNYVNAWTDAGIGSSFINSIVVVAGALVIVMLLGAMCSYVLARFHFFGARAIYYLMLAGLTFPIFLAIVPLFFTLKNFGLLNTLPGLILTYVAFALPFTVFFLYSFFRSLPDEIAEAAAIDGAGGVADLFLVMLPMARTGFASVAIFNFLGLWNQFLIPVALNTNVDNYVLSQRMAAFASATNYRVDYGALFAAVVITVVPVLIVYIIFARQLQGSVSQGTNK